MAQRLILLSSARFAPALAHSRPDSFEVEPAICRRPVQLMQLTEIWKTQEPLTGNHLGPPFLSSASARLDSLLVLPARPSRSPRITARHELPPCPFTLSGPQPRLVMSIARLSFRIARLAAMARSAPSSPRWTLLVSTTTTARRQCQAACSVLGCTPGEVRECAIAVT